ncbi:MAG TPA: heme-binding protein [Micropepsaceae bacterium]|nr:heme-binding protein [Micropepsaceae bacterium]
MRLYVGLAAAAAATAMIGAALAAESDKFVIRGDNSKVIMEQNSINIATAEAIAKACVDEATKENVRVSIAIYDQFGEPVYFYRMDGQGKANVDTSFMKARTALNVRAPSKTVMNQVLQGRASELRQYSFGNFANSGGLPIIVNGNQMIGAIGVGGSAPRVPVWSDEICAWRALNKVMGQQPPLLPDVTPAAAAGGGRGNGGRAGAPNQ